MQVYDFFSLPPFFFFPSPHPSTRFSYLFGERRANLAEGAGGQSRAAGGGNGLFFFFPPFSPPLFFLSIRAHSDRYIEI